MVTDEREIEVTDERIRQSEETLQLLRQSEAYLRRELDAVRTRLDEEVSLLHSLTILKNLK